jgi:hypothetical protein
MMRLESACELRLSADAARLATFVHECTRAYWQRLNFSETADKLQQPNTSFFLLLDSTQKQIKINLQK